MYNRYLYYLLGALNRLPKEPEAVFYRGITCDEFKVPRSHAHAHVRAQARAHTQRTHYTRAHTPSAMESRYGAETLA